MKDAVPYLYDKQFLIRPMNWELVPYLSIELPYMSDGYSLCVGWLFHICPMKLS